MIEMVRQYVLMNKTGLRDMNSLELKENIPLEVYFTSDGNLIVGEDNTDEVEVIAKAKAIWQIAHDYNVWGNTEKLNEILKQEKDKLKELTLKNKYEKMHWLISRDLEFAYGKARMWNLDVELTEIKRNAIYTSTKKIKLIKGANVELDTENNILRALNRFEFALAIIQEYSEKKFVFIGDLCVYIFTVQE